MSEIENAEIENAEQETEKVYDFPESTVFYRDLLVDGDVISLGTAVKDPRVADSYGLLDKHFDESELTYIGTPECGTWYLKGHEKPEETREEKIERICAEVVTGIQELLDATAHSKGYDSGEMLATYATDPDPEFGAQGRAYVAWRSRCWRKCYSILDQVLAGELEPEDVTVSFVLGALPPLEW